MLIVLDEKDPRISQLLSITQRRLLNVNQIAFVSMSRSGLMTGTGPSSLVLGCIHLIFISNSGYHEAYEIRSGPCTWQIVPSHFFIGC
jgi:hypothetical protein